MIELYEGTIGSGKSYHALERVIETLEKGKFVVANFPLNFTEGMLRRGYAERFMYVPDEFMMGEEGVAFLYQLQKRMEFYDKYGEGACLVLIDEAGNYFAPEDNAKWSNRLWKTFFTQSRKMGYDFILITQDSASQINKTIRKCCEYKVVHRKANNVFPFKLLPFTLFMYVTFWGPKNQRLSSSSSIYVKRFGKLYNTSMMFGNIDDKFDLDFKELEHELGFALDFGNCGPRKEVVTVDVEDKDESGTSAAV